MLILLLINSQHLFYCEFVRGLHFWGPTGIDVFQCFTTPLLLIGKCGPGVQVSTPSSLESTVCNRQSTVQYTLQQQHTLNKHNKPKHNKHNSANMQHTNTSKHNNSTQHKHIINQDITIHINITTKHIDNKHKHTDTTTCLPY